MQSQYIFVHDAMLEYLFCKNTFVEASVFANKLKSLQEENVETGNTFLEDEYEVSCLIWVKFGYMALADIKCRENIFAGS